MTNASKKSENTAKTKRTVPKSAWPKGVSGNPGGRPKNEQSISYWLKDFGQQTPAQLAELCANYASELKKVKGDMPMFAHIAIRALMGQINEPTPGLFSVILERTEGKVKDQVELTGDAAAPIRIEIAYSHPSDAAEPAPGPADDQAVEP